MLGAKGGPKVGKALALADRSSLGGGGGGGGGGGYGGTFSAVGGGGAGGGALGVQRCSSHVGR